MSRTAYTTVIVTRNRPDALAMSLPLHLAQSQLPERIIVIDSSDDPKANAAIVDRLATTSRTRLEHQTAPPGMTIQRNIGLAQVETDVVFFPDDDSHVYPGALAAMMRLYDLDAGHRIGGVCAAEAITPPSLAGDVMKIGGKKTSMRLSDRVRVRIAGPRNRLEARYFPDPFRMVADRLLQRLAAAPEWLATENAIAVPWMTGFRMSFRTDVVRRHGFNEHLGRYALFEDTDAGFGVLRSHLLVGARNAQIFHNKAPERRAGGQALGAMQVLNRGYVVCRSGEAVAEIRAATRAFSRYKIAQYALGASNSYGRDRLRGALAAYRVLPELFEAAPERLDDVYLGLRSKIFGNEEFHRK